MSALRKADGLKRRNDRIYTCTIVSKTADNKKQISVMGFNVLYLKLEKRIYVFLQSGECLNTVHKFDDMSVCDDTLYELKCLINVQNG